MEKEIKIPEVGESVSEVVIAEWLKKEGDYVEVDEPICEIDSDKASFEIPSEEAGVLNILVKEGETVAIGDTIAKINTDRKKQKSEKDKRESKVESKQEVKDTKSEETKEDEKKRKATAEKPKISPVADKILSDAGISPEKIKGSGIGGRITKEDALKALEEMETNGREQKDEKRDTAQEVETREEKKTDLKAPTITEGMRTERREKMTTLRKTISRRLVAAKNETAMLTTFNEVSMKAIMDLRAKYKDSFIEKYEVNLGFMSFFTKAVCNAVNEWPAVNAKIDGDEIVYHDYCDISIAVSTERGLVTPIIRNADKLSLAQIEHEVLRLAEKARNGKLSIDEMTGGTFTISNGGVFGSLMATPILNPPQSAILGMHKIEERPIVLDGQIVIRPMMYLALSYDHRIIDGRESVSFLVRVKEMLEDPARLLLDI
jgi:2-oxoglutarate dehydrogenase E2 component (dihydrolipoamide succinyltransferase)